MLSVKKVLAGSTLVHFTVCLVWCAIAFYANTGASSETYTVAAPTVTVSPRPSVTGGQEAPAPIREGTPTTAPSGRPSPRPTVRSGPARTTAPPSRPSSVRAPSQARPGTLPAQPATTAAPQADDRTLRGKVLEVKHREPRVIVHAVSPLASGRGAISFNDELRTITIRDYPEVITTIEEAIKRLDVPVSGNRRPNINFAVHVLVAANARGADESVPPDLADVVRQLKSTLKYQSYSLMTSAILRTKVGSGRVENSGVVESKLFTLEKPEGNPIFYSYHLQQPPTDPAWLPAAGVTLDFKFSMKIPVNTATNIQYENVGFHTPVTLRDSEKVVVGTTTMADKGLIVVVQARFVD